MTFSESYLAEFDHESISIRKILERIPSDKFDWAPHPKSMKLGALAVHISSLAGRARSILTVKEVDRSSPAGPIPPPPANTQELIQQWDRHVADLHAAVREASEEQIEEIFTLKMGSEVLFSMPRKAALRIIVLKHMIHHRGQLSVYLRLLDIPVPSIYGPSADEKGGIVAD